MLLEEVRHHNLRIGRIQVKDEVEGRLFHLSGCFVALLADFELRNLIVSQLLYFLVEINLLKILEERLHVLPYEMHDILLLH